LPFHLRDQLLLLLIAFNVYNALNFIFQALMARMLGLADFSIYGPLSALIYLLAVVTDSSQTVITKYTSGKVDDGKVKNILKRALRKSFFAALILFLAYSFILIPLAQVLRVPFRSILTASAFSTINAEGIEFTPNYVITNTGQVFHSTAT
jgi:O-antigen/teichoic acid export membrane protein